jgi:hypothetical protein
MEIDPLRRAGSGFIGSSPEERYEVQFPSGNVIFFESLLEAFGIAGEESLIQTFGLDNLESDLELGESCKGDCGVAQFKPRP